MAVRQLLGLDDFDKFLEITQAFKKVGGTTPPTYEQLEAAYSKYFFNDQENFSKFQALGYEEEGKLISVICLGYIENKSRGKFWAAPAFFSTKNHNLFSFNNPEVGLLIKAALENAESHGYYEYYYCIAEQVSRVYEKQIDKNNYIPVSRYERITLATIPKNTVPEIELYARLIGNQPKPHNVIIKKRVLREEFRKKA